MCPERREGFPMRTWSRIPALVPALLLGAPGWLWSQSGVPGGSRSAVIGVAALLFGLAAAIVAVILYRRQNDRRPEDTIPLLVFPAAPASASRHPRRAAPAAPAPRAETAVPVAAPAAASAVATPLASPAGMFPAGRPAPPPFEWTPPAAEVPAAPRPVANEEATVVDGRTIRFHRPTDGTLQILPGRLEVVDGADTGQQIRFVRAGSEPEVTFGRSEGPPYRHVQLRAATVSRQHARMRFTAGGWSIANLSLTNPVMLNGQELPQNGEEHPLQDGDRIEMGEIAFVYRER
jgi:hypothetical protein